jgi:hypothetical protein
MRAVPYAGAAPPCSRYPLRADTSIRPYGALCPRTPDQAFRGASPPGRFAPGPRWDAPGRFAPGPPMRGTEPVPLKPLRQARLSQPEAHRLMPWPSDSGGADRSTHPCANASSGCPEACAQCLMRVLRPRPPLRADTSIRPYGALRPRTPDQAFRGASPPGRFAPGPPMRGTEPVPQKPLRQRRPSHPTAYRLMPWPSDSVGAHRSTHVFCQQSFGMPRGMRAERCIYDSAK